MTKFERVNRMKTENLYKVCEYFYLNYDYFLALEYSDTGSWYPLSLGSNVELHDMFCSVLQRAVADLNFQVRERGGHPDPEISGGSLVSKKFFQPSGPQFGLNTRGDGPPGPLPYGSAVKHGRARGKANYIILKQPVHAILHCMHYYDYLFFVVVLGSY